VEEVRHFPAALPKDLPLKGHIHSSVAGYKACGSASVILNLRILAEKWAVPRLSFPNGARLL